jgi:hypothetical protein
MADLPSKKDIDKISLEILKGSKSLDVFPTSVDKIVAYSELIVRNDIDVSKIHEGYFAKVEYRIRHAFGKTFWNFYTCCLRRFVECSKNRCALID